MWIEPCRKCGATERTALGVCKPCKKACDAAHYIKNRTKIKANILAWNLANVEKVKAYKVAWAKANQGKVKASRAAYSAANPDKIKKSRLTWRAAHPELIRIWDNNRRAKERKVNGKLSYDLVDRLLKLQRGKCACGCKQPLGNNFHRDHIMPLALGGPNTDDNIQLLRQTCNNKKSAKHPIDFMQQRGFLL